MTDEEIVVAFIRKTKGGQKKYTFATPIHNEEKWYNGLWYASWSPHPGAGGWQDGWVELKDGECRWVSKND
jgi:hypothetical protein